MEAVYHHTTPKRFKARSASERLRQLKKRYTLRGTVKICAASLFVKTSDLVTKSLSFISRSYLLFLKSRKHGCGCDNNQ